MKQKQKSMNNHELLKKLYNYKELRIGGKPRECWKSSNREILMSQIKSQIGSTEALGYFAYFFNSIKAHWQISKLALKPVGAIAAMLVVVLGGGTIGVWASKNSLPGDTLYNVKIASEKAQLGLLTYSTDEKAKLDITFAERRVQELSQVLNDSNRSNVAIKGLEDNLNDIKDRMNSLKSSNESQKVLEVAKQVKEKTKQFEMALINQGDGQTQKALNMIDSANTNALTIIIGQGNTQEVRTDLEEKISKLEQKVLDKKAAESTQIIKEGADNTNNTAETSGTENTDTNITQKIDSAKQLLEQNDYQGVITIISETQQIIGDSEQQNTEVNANTNTEEIGTDLIKE